MKKTITVLLFLILIGLTKVLGQTPTITAFSPSIGPVGTLVTITGTNLSSPTAFSIGSLTAIVVSNTGTTLKGMVMPSTNSGAISITTSNGTATSAGNFIVTPTPYPSIQQGNKLSGTGSPGVAGQGTSLAISADGNTAIVGGNSDNGGQGAVWIYTRTAGNWSQQGDKLVGTGGSDYANQGYAVALSADGNTALVGGLMDGVYQGATWVFTRTAGIWSQQGNKLVGTGATDNATQGSSVSLSADGNTALIGGDGDNNYQGATWVFTRTAGAWSQQGDKLVGSGGSPDAFQGASVSLSGDGNTALVGGSYDNMGVGAAWVFTRTAGTWSQQGDKLIGSGGSIDAYQGWSVAISSDGNTAIVGGGYDNNGAGAAWVFTRSDGNWSQQGDKLVGAGGSADAQQGYSVSLSADGNTALVGGPTDNSAEGAAWVFTRNAGNWSQQGDKLVGTGGSINAATQGSSVALTADGNLALVGAPLENNSEGATWAFTRSAATWSQQGKLVGTGATAQSLQGTTIALSADGNTAIVGGPMDENTQGAAWIFTRSAGIWSQQGDKLVGTGGSIDGYQGSSVAISADGNTAIVGGKNDNSYQGAVWIFTRTAGIWSQQGSKLVGSGGSADAEQGRSVAISADGNTAIVGGHNDNSLHGAAWVFTRTDSTWSQQGSKLVGSNSSNAAKQGSVVSISADGNTVIIGGVNDNNGTGAVWVFTRTVGTWSQQGNKLVCTGNAGIAEFGGSVALSADGNTAIIGGYNDNYSDGATWIFIRTGSTWSQQGGKLRGSGGTDKSFQGMSVSISADGNTAMFGGFDDNNGMGAAWVFTRTAGTWSQQGDKLVGTNGSVNANQDHSLALSADGTTAIMGGPNDNGGMGSAWVFRACIPPTIVSQSTAAQTQCIGGAFSAITLSATGEGLLSYQWYSNSTASTNGGTSLGSGNGAQTISYIPQTSTAGTLYYYCVVHSDCSTNVTSIISGAFIVNPETTINSQSTAAQSECLNGLFTPITVTATGANLTYQWYSNSTANNSGGNNLGSGNGAQTSSYTPQVSIPGNLYYYCIIHGDCGTDVKTSVSGAFTVNANPGAPTGSSTQTYCSVDAKTIADLTTTLTGSNISWYNAASGGSVLSSSTVLTTGNYYASQTINCESTNRKLVAVTINTTPNAPDISGITPGNNSLSVAFTASTIGCTAITDYKYSTDGGSTFTSAGTTTSPIVITGLTNGTSYNVQIKAVNVNGDGTASESTLGIPTPLTVSISNDANLSPYYPTSATDVTVSAGELTVDANATVKSMTVNPGGKLTLAAGKTLNVTGAITLQSDAGGTGTFVDMNATNANGLSVNGTTTVQQYVTSTAKGVTGRNWYISSPVSAALSSTITSATTNDLVSYNETSGVWINAGTMMDIMKGYIAVSPAQNTTLIFNNGTLNTGTKSVNNLSYTGATKKGFNLIGNPYPSYLDWDGATISNMLTTVWYRSKRTGSYLFQTYNSLGGILTALNGGTNLIPPMQAFWVRATSSTNSVSFDNSLRSHQDQTIATNRLKAPSKNNQVLQVLRLEVSNGINSDETVVYSNINALNGVDNYDSPKMTNANITIPELFTLVDGEQMAINGMNSIPFDTEIPLGFTTGQSNSFSIKASLFSNFEAGTKILLKDYLDIKYPVLTDLSDGSSYSFTSEVTSNNINRFTLTFKAPSSTSGLDNEPNVNLWISLHNSQISVNGITSGATLEVFNTLGQKIISRNFSGANIQLNTNLAAGAYLIRLTNEGKNIVRKIIID